MNAGQSYIGQLEERVKEIVDRMNRRAIVWLFPSFEEALYAASTYAARTGCSTPCSRRSRRARSPSSVRSIRTAYELLAQSRPRVTRIFEVIRLAPMPTTTHSRSRADWSRDYGVDVDDDTLAESLDLATHYLPGTAAPGNVLRLLELVRDRVARGLATEVTPESVIATLSAATGLPLHVLDPRAPLRLDDVRAFFEEPRPRAARGGRVPRRQDRAGEGRAHRPDPALGVFLFVGPTGTGKTEIAKALSEFLFGSQDRLVRLDMSEFQTPESLERLLGGHDDRGCRQRPLIASVRKHPFSVRPARRVREGAPARSGTSSSRSSTTAG